MTKKLLNGGVLTLFLFVALQARGQTDLSLSQAIAIGLKNNFQIQIADKNVEIAQNSDRWSIAGRYPSIDLSLNSNNGFNHLENPASFTQQVDSWSINASPGVNASLVLFDGYRVRITKQQLEKLAIQSKGDAKVVVENTIQAIILAYYQALIQKEQLSVLEEVLALSKDRIEYQEIRKEYGQSSTFDVLQTKDAYLNDSTNYLIQVNSYETALRNLNLTMRVENLSTRYHLVDRLAFEVPDYQLADLKEKMLADNQDLQNLYTQRELAGISTKLQRGSRFPTLRLNTGGGINRTSSKVNIVFAQGDPLDQVVKTRSFNFFFNLSATYNLFDAGVKKRNIENAQMREIMVQMQAEDLKHTLSAQLENTLSTFNNQRRLVLLTQELVENAQKNIEIAAERFKGGLINSFDFRTIQLNYINASQSRLNAIFNLKNTETELIRLTGGLVR